MKILINLLSHFEIDARNKLSYMPRGLGELIQLQALTLFRVGNGGECSRQERENG